MGFALFSAFDVKKYRHSERHSCGKDTLVVEKQLTF